MDRRKFIALSGVAVVALLQGCDGSKNSAGSNTAKKTLPIPPLLKGEAREGVMHYDLTLQEATHQFFEGINTSTWGINQSYLGPTLLLTKGEEVSINYTNNLTETTTMHGHGMRVPGSMDGTAHQPITPGQTWSSRFKVLNQACTNWYHPHTLHKTARHVYQGLAGLIIVEDDYSKSLNLPNRYGIDDIPLVLQDRFFSSDKRSLNYEPNMRQLVRGYIGDTFIANGAIEPVFEAEAALLRLRILNGSNSSVYNLGFDDGRSFDQIATDNGFLEKPVALTQLTLSPGERAEIIVDCTGDFGKRFTLREFNNNKTFLTIEVNKQAQASTSLPSTLTTLEPLLTPIRTRSFELGMAGMSNFTINGKMMDITRIDVALKPGDVEEWEIINEMGMGMMGMEHNFHIHGMHFRILSRDDDPSKVAMNEKGYKDTVYVPPRSRVKILVAVPDDGITADANNPYMFHCHFLEHEDNGMMGQFTVG